MPKKWRDYPDVDVDAPLWRTADLLLCIVCRIGSCFIYEENLERISVLKGVGEKTEQLFIKAGVHTIGRSSAFIRGPMISMKIR